MSSFQPREGLPIGQMPEWSGSALQKRRRRFNSGSGLQAPVARAERHRSSKSAHAGSNPAWSSFTFFHGRVAQRMSADLLHQRMHVQIVPRSPIWRVNWAGAQRRLLSDRPAHAGENRALNSPPDQCGHGVLGCVLGFQPRRVSSILTARTKPTFV